MASAYSVGDWIGGRFQVFDVHEGGMSLVYVVNDHLAAAPPKVVALKTLRSELLHSRVRVGRFASECRLWVQLGEHPNIVRAYSVELIDGQPYVVLELVQGGDLNRWIGTPRLDLRQALRFGFQFCLGMEHALRQGLHCHRDVKPGNLLVTENGTLKITDFGLARICEEMVAVCPELPDGSIPLAQVTTSQPIIWTDPRDCDLHSTTVAPGAGLPALATEPRPAADLTSGPRNVPTGGPTNPRFSPSSETASPPLDAQSLTTLDKETSEYLSPLETADPRLTRAGARLGTLAYMAPEQFRDPRSVDIRADLYAFGVVLFEMLTGQLPFKGQSLDALSRQHERLTPPSIVPSIPSRYAKFAISIDEIVQRCLKKEPHDRFKSVGELRQVLKQLLAQLPR